MLFGAGVAVLQLPSAASMPGGVALSGGLAVPRLPTPSASPAGERDEPHGGERAGRGDERLATAPASAAEPTEPSGPPVPARPAATQPAATQPAANSGTCQVSYYSDGGHTASGEVFDPTQFTAAHPTLPFNTRVRVTNVANGKSVVVRINDRGPFVPGRCLDLSSAAFGQIASLGAGVATVRYNVLA